ncbi:uncharacterized protein LOC9649427 [Selaginella moellendorffii]|uniref:uncharacterized protein LOC9649427 n=1 Tax=Selaginella moellendorffii TaxID=88036 RepID=UPI000D1C2593|nr:uncharacterized protein LOC9649427 [Selaginella moellendorffii]|eukprot:XP_024516074.1 uncharacterized protein LOC9649427 [Selaginella moellendorffii]
MDGRLACLRLSRHADFDRTCVFSSRKEGRRDSTDTRSEAFLLWPLRGNKFIILSLEFIVVAMLLPSKVSNAFCQDQCFRSVKLVAIGRNLSFVRHHRLSDSLLRKDRVVKRQRGGSKQAIAIVGPA